jgi:hypothetical protein
LLEELVANEKARRPGSSIEVLHSLGAFDRDHQGRPAHIRRSRIVSEYLDAAESRRVILGLNNDAWLTLLLEWGNRGQVARVASGVELIREADQDYEVYVLLRGQVEFTQQGKFVGSTDLQAKFLERSPV